MPRKFVVEVKKAAGPYYGMYVTLLENLEGAPLDPEHPWPWRVWYHDRLLRPSDVKPTVKNHIEFVKSFGDDVEVEIRDLRNVQQTYDSSSIDITRDNDPDERVSVRRR